MDSFRTQFQRVRSVFHSDKPSETKQEFKNECDINLLVKKMDAGLDITPSSIARGKSRRMPQFGDFSQFFDFREMNDKINNAREQFEALPAEIRERFHNDPASLIAAIEDPNRRDEMEKLGFVIPKKVESEVIKPVDGSIKVDEQTDKDKKPSAII
jgi:phage internal scaffolding protein